MRTHRQDKGTEKQKQKICQMTNLSSNPPRRTNLFLRTPRQAVITQLTKVMAVMEAKMPTMKAVTTAIRYQVRREHHRLLIVKVTRCPIRTISRHPTERKMQHQVMRTSPCQTPIHSHPVTLILRHLEARTRAATRRPQLEEFANFRMAVDRAVTPALPALPTTTEARPANQNQTPPQTTTRKLTTATKRQMTKRQLRVSKMHIKRIQPQKDERSGNHEQAGKDQV